MPDVLTGSIGLFSARYTYPDKFPKYVGTGDYIDADEVELDTFYAYDGQLVYVVDIFSTEDGFTIVLTADEGGNFDFWSSNADFEKVRRGKK